MYMPPAKSESPLKKFVSLFVVLMVLRIGHPAWIVFWLFAALLALRVGLPAIAFIMGLLVALMPFFYVAVFHILLGMDKDNIPVWSWSLFPSAMYLSMWALGMRYGAVLMLPSWALFYFLPRP